MAASFVTGTVSVTFVLCTLLGTAVTGNDRPTVHVEDGTLAGQRIVYRGKELDVFYSIPYAEPPVGELRYERARPPKPWDGTLDAIRLPSACPQIELLFSLNTSLNYSDASEDCLYINVIKSACSNASMCAKARPVMVFIHGGAFQWGDSSIFYFDGTNFAATTDIIVASFNYRVGILGFLSTESSVHPGNTGLWDQLLALKWVKKNIAKFGGDPEDITLCGQSAGGMSVGLHALTPQSKGLFKRIILESGTPLSMVLTQSYRGVARLVTLAGRLGCYDNNKDWMQQINEVVMCMKTKETADIFAKMREMEYTQQIFVPVFGDEFMPESPLEMNPLKVRATEVFAGTTLNEGTLMVENLRYVAPQLFASLPHDYRTGVTLAASVLFDIPVGASNKIVQAYYGGYEVQHDYQEVLDILGEMIGDVIFVCPTNFFLMAAAEQGISSYRYVFAYRPTHSFWPKWMGVTHSEDLPYLMGSLPHLKEEMTNKNSKWRYLAEKLDATDFKYLPKEEDFMNQVLGAWRSFIVKGKPTVPLSDEQWPKYSASSPDFYYLQPNNYTRGRGPKLDRCELWKPYIMKQKTARPTPRPKPIPRRQPTHGKKPASRNGGTTGPIDNTISSGTATFAPSGALLTLVAFTPLLLH